MKPASSIKRAKRWAKRQMLFELRVDIAQYGYACNVQLTPGDSPEDKAKRREARRLLRIAIKAVEDAR